jgi:hypothetical protein
LQSDQHDSNSDHWLRDLQNEGNFHCTIETDASEVPEFAQKNANLNCGQKRIVLNLQRLGKQDEIVQLDLELHAR